MRCSVTTPRSPQLFRRDLCQIVAVLWLGRLLQQVGCVAYCPLVQHGRCARQAEPLSGRAFTIHIRHYPGIIYKKVGVSLNGRPVRVANGRTAAVNLRGLTKGRYIVFITATTTTGAKIGGTRTYHTRAKKPIHPKRHSRL